MPDELRMMVFDVRAESDIGKGWTYVEDNTAMTESLSNSIVKFNEKAELVAEKIEREVKKHMPPYMSVQANIKFEEGSLILTGTVALLSWGGPIVFEAAKEEAAQQLSRLVKASVQRAINLVFKNDRGLLLAAASMNMTVTPMAPSSSALVVRTKASPMAESTSQEGVVRPNIPSPYQGLIAAMILLFLIQLLLVLDRFLVAKLRDDVATHHARNSIGV
jgi:hypothetical protein